MNFFFQKISFLFPNLYQWIILCLLTSKKVEKKVNFVSYYEKNIEIKRWNLVWILLYIWCLKVSSNIKKGHGDRFQIKRNSTLWTSRTYRWNDRSNYSRPHWAQHNPTSSVCQRPRTSDGRTAITFIVRKQSATVRHRRKEVSTGR